MRQLQLMVLLGSTKDQSSNHKLVKYLENTVKAKHNTDQQQATEYSWNIFPIGALPFFDPDLDKAPLEPNTAEKSRRDDHPNEEGKDASLDPLEVNSKVPTVVQQLRQKVADADGILICTPEYVFSLPGILKNALEWLVSTTSLTDKPMALVTAAADGRQAQQSLERIVGTLGGKFTAQSSIRIPGAAGKFDKQGLLNDSATAASLQQLLDAWLNMIENQTLAAVED